jgi:hypothetical protein
MFDVNTGKLLDWERRTRPLVREGVPQRQDSNFQTTTFGQEVISGHKFQSGLDTLTYWLTDRPSVVMWLWLRMGEGIYRTTYSWPRHYLEVSGQHHDPEFVILFVCLLPNLLVALLNGRDYTRKEKIKKSKSLVQCISFSCQAWLTSSLFV